MNNAKNKRNYLQIDPQIEKEQFDFLIKKGYKFDSNFNLIGPKGKLLTATKNGYNYMLVHINNIPVNIYAHRFSYYYHNSVVPVYTINHIDNNKFNNNPNNLEDVTLGENAKALRKVRDSIIQDKKGNFKLYEKGKVIHTADSYNKCLHVKLLKGLFERQREEEMIEQIQKCKTKSEMDKYIESTIFE